MAVRNQKHRKLEIWLMVGALLLMFVGLPVGLYFANGFNAFLSGTNDYTQVENTTAFYNGTLVSGKAVEGRYGSVNGTSAPILNDTWAWDAVSEWDQVTIVNTGTDVGLIMNWNMTPAKLLDSKINDFQMQFNCSDHLKVTINAVKFDGVTLTSVQAYQNTHVTNSSTTIRWNITPIGVLTLQNDLNSAATDEVYFQIIIEGYDASNKLTIGDTIQFQFATGESGNVYAFTSKQILQGSVTILGMTFVLFGFASTPYWNPFGEDKKPSGPSKKRTPKKTTKRRR